MEKLMKLKENLQALSAMWLMNCPTPRLYRKYIKKN